MSYTNLTNITSSNTLPDLFIAMNNSINGGFAILTISSIWIVIFLSIRNNTSTQQSIITAGYAGIALSIFFWAAQLLPLKTTVMLIVIGAISIAVSFLTDR